MFHRSALSLSSFLLFSGYCIVYCLARKRRIYPFVWRVSSEKERYVSRALNSHQFSLFPFLFVSFHNPFLNSFKSFFLFPCRWNIIARRGRLSFSGIGQGHVLPTGLFLVSWLWLYFGCTSVELLSFFRRSPNLFRLLFLFDISARHFGDDLTLRISRSFIPYVDTKLTYA